MSRIQQILDKAEREGRMRRTTATEPPAPAAAPPAAAPAAPIATHAPTGATSPGASSTWAPAAFTPLPAPQPAPPPLREAEPGQRPSDGNAGGSPHGMASRIAALRARHAAAPPAPFTAAPGAAPAPSVPSPVVAPARESDGRLHRVLVAAMLPRSASAEQYRALRTRITQAEHNRQYRAILVTSPAQGDGKSVTSANLALAMAQEFHRRVLLIDADLRSSSLHRLFGIPGRPGLSDVLLGDAQLEEALITLPDHRLTILPAGTRVNEAPELLASAEMRRVVDTLRTQFDRIVLDTPPAAPLADVGILAPLVDGVLLVVRAGYTQRPAIDRALEDIEPERVLGLVLNDVEEVANSYGYGAPAPGGQARRQDDRRTA